MRSPIEPDLAGSDAARWFQQPDDRHAGERLARARFAHDAQHLAASDGEGDVVHRDQRPAAGRELDPQVLYFEQRGETSSNR